MTCLWWSMRAIQLITLENKQIRYFVKGLNFGIQIVSLSVADLGKSFQEVVKFLKKDEAIGKQGDVKVDKEKAQTSGQFNSTFLKGRGSQGSSS